MANPAALASLRSLPDALALAKRWLRQLWFFPANERLEFYDNMASMTSATITTDKAIVHIAAENRRLNRRAVAVYDSLREQLTQSKLPKLMAEWAPRSELMVLSAGDLSNQADGFRAAAKLLRRARKMRASVGKAMAYPAVLLVGAFLSIRFTGSKLLPQLERSLRGRPWPEDAVSYVTFVEFVRDYGLWLAGGLCGLALLLFVLASRWTGLGRANMDRFFPPYMLYRLVVAASLLMALDALTRTTMTLRDALISTLDDASPYMAHHVRQIIAAMGDTKNVSAAFHTGLFPPSIVIRITALGASGSYTDKLHECADDALEYCQSRIDTVGNLLNGIAVLIMGGFVAWTLMFNASLDFSAPMR